MPRSLRKTRLQLEALEDRSVPSATMIDLGPGFTAVSVNNAGLVAGSFNNHAALWKDGVVLADLGTLGGATSRANDVNALGQVAGTAYRSDGNFHAFLVTPEDTDADGKPDLWFRDNDLNGINDLMLDLGTLGGATSSAVALNDHGQVFGTASTSTSSSNVCFLWDGGTMRNLGNFGGNYQLSPGGINNNGQVVGTAISYVGGPEGGRHFYAFSWDPVSGERLLPHLSGDNVGTAAGINDAGQIVGVSGHQAFGPSFTVHDAYLYQKGSITGLAMPVPYWNARLYINNNGQVVGSTYLRQGGATVNLIDLIDPAEGWTNITTSDINDAGQIVGVGTHNGVSTSFVLTLPATISISPGVSVTEGNSGTASAVFTVTRSGRTNQITTVNYNTADGTASAGSDYVATSGTITFNPGETTQTITVAVNGDRLGEPNETFVVNLSSPMNGTISGGQAIGTIVDDEPRISISDVAKSEGKRGQTTLFTFTVTLSAAYDQAVTMSFDTVDGTATANDKDYVAQTGTLTFNPGETSKTITIVVNGDSKKEGDESFFVELFGNSSNSLFTKNRGLGTILNDD